MHDRERYVNCASPIDAAVTCRTMLGGAVIQMAEVRAGTRDIIIDFESGDRLEIIPLSSGFESWQIAAPGGTITIAQGGGNLVAWRADD